MTHDLGDEVVLVTGGSSGVGAAIARRLARAGAKVKISYSRNAEGADRLVNALTAEGCAIAARQADHDDPEAAAACIDSVVRHEGRLDILVNNAAVGKPAPLQDVTTAIAERQFWINLIAPLMAIRAAAPHLAASGGCVVSVSSINAQNPVPGASVYCATKAALEALTKSLARELGPSGVRVNAVAPGPTKTPMLARALPSGQRTAVMAHTPLGGSETPETSRRQSLGAASAQGIRRDPPAVQSFASTTRSNHACEDLGNAI